MANPVRIAIVGGSMTGCTLANGLLRYPNVIFDIFESKASFEERGASVGVALNAQKALRAMGMDAEGALKSAGAMKMGKSVCLAGIGEHKGKPVLELSGGTHIVDRSEWLKVLLKELPKDRLHANKKVSTIQQSSAKQTYTLQFEDGSTHEADAVVGCDGLYSKVRQMVLGPENEKLWKPVFAGYWDARGRTTPQMAAEHFGTKLFDPTVANEVALCGDKAFLLFAPTDNGKTYHVIIACAADPDFDQTSWKTELTREYLEKHCKDWSECFRVGVIESLMAEDSGPGVVFSQWESPEIPTYCRDELCVLGDAAHATTPWMGQGACLAIEDAAVLSTLIGSIRDRQGLSSAFKAFDILRRGRQNT